MAYLQGGSNYLPFEHRCIFTLQLTFTKGSSFLNTLNLSIIQRQETKENPSSVSWNCVQGASFQSSNHYREGLFCTCHQRLWPAFRNCHRNLCKILSSSCWGEDPFPIVPFKVIVNEEWIFAISHYFCFTRLRRKSVNMCSYSGIFP